jgi:flagellar biosynthesis protein FliR
MIVGDALSFPHDETVVLPFLNLDTHHLLLVFIFLSLKSTAIEKSLLNCESSARFNGAVVDSHVT